jgi:hypothetical protein
VVVILVVPAGLRDDDPLDEAMQETACEADPGIEFVLVAGRRRGHGSVCCLRHSSQRPMVPSSQVHAEPQAERLVSNSVPPIDRPTRTGMFSAPRGSWLACTRNLIFQRDNQRL